MIFPHDQQPKDDVKEPQMAAIPPLRQWLRDKETRQNLAFLRREFQVTPDRAFEMLIAFETWHDMDPMPYEPDGDMDG